MFPREVTPILLHTDASLDNPTFFSNFFLTQRCILVGKEIYKVDLLIQKKKGKRWNRWKREIDMLNYREKREREIGHEETTSQSK